MKIKILILLVALAAVVMMLASCGGNGGSEQSGPSILIALYENDNKGELSSGLKRYLAGGDDAYHAQIDAYVQERNTAAEETTGVEAEYVYRNKASYTWGNSVSDIQKEVKAGASSSPDVYVNFAYDMTSLALNGCFANLLSNSSHTSTTYPGGENEFLFTEEGYVGTGENYFDSDAGKGYFYDYMKSLAFANSNGEYDKMYCLASDYCIDMVRSFLVIPVNVNMIGSIAVKDSNGDKDGDGDFDIHDFYQDVWEGNWTYDTLAKYSNAVFVNSNQANSASDIKDTLGAAFGKSSGLTPSGFLYTSSVQIINRDVAGQYKYLETNQDLIDFTNELYDLFFQNGSKGICSVNKADVNNAGLGDSSDQGELVGIRQRFGEGKILFGGIVALGSLEEKEYQDMKANGGFGIVPVPVYKAGDEYLTLVHNIARIVGISVKTTDFVDCTKYLNYQSTNSAKILNAYYDQELVAAVSGGEATDYNKDMLTYVRTHVRDCFDKTYEDVISAYLTGKGDENALATRWHTILSNQSYMVTNISTDYDRLAREKQNYLEKTLDEWAALD